MAKDVESNTATSPSPSTDYETRYKELEKKLGEQGRELGEYKKQARDYASQYETVARWAQQAAPIVSWYGQYNQPLQQWWQQYQTQQTQPFGSGGGSMTPNTQQAGYAAMQQATQAVNAQPGVELLTQSEKDALINQTAQRIFQAAIQPWTQNFARTVEDWGRSQATTLSNQLDQRHKAFSDVLWKTLERVLPQEKLQETRQWHDQALKYADPRNIDPLTLASETLSLREKSDRLEKERDEAVKAREKAERDSLGSLGNSSGLFHKSSDLKQMPESREDRFRNVMTTVRDTVGTDGLREQFPSQ